jgi:AhpD family alkylhydroperoxidase
MKDQIKELIAVGASVTANCQPCLIYHVKEARKYGADEESIQEAIEVGQMVKKGAMRKYNEFIPTIFETAKKPD